jgi:hypothetical protein
MATPAPYLNNIHSEKEANEPVHSYQKEVNTAHSIFSKENGMHLSWHHAVTRLQRFLALHD